MGLSEILWVVAKPGCLWSVMKWAQFCGLKVRMPVPEMEGVWVSCEDDFQRGMMEGFTRVEEVESWGQEIPRVIIHGKTGGVH